MASTNSTPLSVPANNPHNVQQTKYYVFNETGNIMLASTDQDSSTIEQSVRDVFAEVSVFFAAMTRAITTTINPATKKPYSLYNYEAMEKVIGGSGLFIHVQEEDVTYKSESFGMQFSKELIEALLGLATGTGEMAFASAMVASLGKAGLDISQSSSSTNSKVANIVFVCEYLLGMPIVSALVVTADLTENKQSLSIGPCFKESSITTTWKLHKDTYMFVTPDFIKEYATDLMSVENDAEYNRFVGFLQGLITSQPVITGVDTTGANPTTAPNKLTSGSSYEIVGENFGTSGTVAMGSIKGTKVTWTPSSIIFTLTGAVKTAVPITITPKGGTAISTPQNYTLA
ncbi:MAG: hypothetical protein AAF597_01835 [Bacteroidota bacterium]